VPDYDRTDRALPAESAPMDAHDRLYTLAEIPAILRVSRTTVFELLASGALASVRIGARRFVTASQIDAFLEALKTRNRPST
jgi:excisionase family DNA binding protein